MLCRLDRAAAPVKSLVLWFAQFLAALEGEATVTALHGKASWLDPARALRDAVEPIAMHATGSAAVRAALLTLGLGRFPAYVAGRAAALGEAAPEAVSSAFAVFEPTRLQATYLAARAAVPTPLLVAVREWTTVESLRQVLDGVDVQPVAGALCAALAGVADPDRPLFTGLAAMPPPAAPHGRLWRACELVREHRGDGHVRAWQAYGLDPVEANVVTELWLDGSGAGPPGSYTSTRGWSPAAVAAALSRLQQRRLVDGAVLTTEGHALRTAVEQDTNRRQEPLVRALGADLGRLVGTLETWSARCVRAGTFTSDPFKRAAG